jgi:hypothetical protein
VGCYAGGQSKLCHKCVTCIYKRLISLQVSHLLVTVVSTYSNLVKVQIFFSYFYILTMTWIQVICNIFTLT